MNCQINANILEDWIASIDVGYNLCSFCHSVKENYYFYLKILYSIEPSELLIFSAGEYCSRLILSNSNEISINYLLLKEFYTEKKLVNFTGINLNKRKNKRKTFLAT